MKVKVFQFKEIF